MTASESSTYEPTHPSGRGLGAALALSAKPQPSFYGTDALPRTCTHTNEDSRAWWKVKLDGVYDIKTVTLTQRDVVQERLDGAAIVVDGKVCAWNLQFTGTKTFACEARGSEIKVQLPGKNYLTICGFVATGTKFVAPVIRATTTKTPTFRPVLEELNTAINHGCSATVYEHKDYQGWKHTITKGLGCHWVNYGKETFAGDHISAIKVHGPCALIVAEHPNGKGATRTFTKGYHSWIGDDINDTTSSIRLDCNDPLEYII